MKDTRRKERLPPLPVLPSLSPDGGLGTREPPTQMYMRRSIGGCPKVTAYTSATTEEDTSDAGEQPAPRCRKHLKSGHHRTGATTVLNKVIWPHKVLYTSAGKPTTYQNILIPIFVQGYLIMMDTEEGLVSQKMVAHFKDYNVRCSTLWVGSC